MNTRLPRFLASGLFVLMGGLFVAAFLLVRSHYAASLSSVESSFGTLLTQQTEILREQIAQQESALFGLVPLEGAAPFEPCLFRGSDGASPSIHSRAIFETDLFIVLPDSVVPACTAGLLDFISRAEADEALAQGIAALPKPAALPFFETAAKRRVETESDLYKKVAAHFNMLELRFEQQTVFRILALLDPSEISLTTSQARFFNTLLAEQQADLEKIKARSFKLWKTSKVIDQTLTRQKGAYRAVIDGHTLSVRKDGLALLYSPKIQTIPSVKLSNTEPIGQHEEIVPGWFAAIPDSAFEEAKQRIRHQYKVGNSILALMLLLSCALAGGMLISARRQRELGAMRTEFIATVSHELRTPLSLIRLHAETLHHGRISEDKIAQYHQTILTESERLSGIVNNVLDFSRMERNKLQLHPEPTDLSALCERIADSFRFRLEQDGFALENAIRSGIVALVDPLAYSQILFNLIDNAIKYSDTEKHIRIELESSEGWNILRISDRGIGIPDRLKKKIFGDFVRADDSKVTARRGSGIGLSIAKRLVEKMGGTIEVFDNEPTGSVFTVKLRDGNETTRG